MKSKLLITKPQKKSIKKQAKKRPTRSRRADVAQSGRKTRARVYPAAEDYPTLTNPKEVDRPVIKMIHDNLTRAYRINRRLPMCFIFDHISPACQFKRGTTYGPNTPFAQWTKEELAEATETDEPDEETGDAKLVPFDPKLYS